MSDSIDLEKFIPFYPDIEDKNFAYDIARKKEFADTKLGVVEPPNKKQGKLLDSQIFAKRFFSPNTPYQKSLVFHLPGTGKTCVSSAIIEAFKASEVDGKPRKPALVFVKNTGLEKAYKNEVTKVCTSGIYFPKPTAHEEKHGMVMTQKAQAARLNKAVEASYTIVTYETFLKKLEPDEILRRKYDNRVIVIDEGHILRLQPSKKKKKAVKGEEPVDVVMMYKQMHHFLHTVQGCRILIFTGTPIWDRTSEIASLMNLLLDESEQLPTGSAFEREFYDENDNLTDEAKALLKERFRGKVSFLRQATSVKKLDMGTKSPWTKYVTVYPCEMSEFQAAYAREAKETAVEIKGTGGKESRTAKGGAVRRLERDAINMVLPVFDSNGNVDAGDYSQAIFKKYTQTQQKKIGSRGGTSMITNYALTNKYLTDELKNNLRDYSAKFAAIIEEAKANPNEVIFIYNENVTGVGGAIMQALIMKLHGFDWIYSAADIVRPDKTRRRFAVITSNEQTTSSATQIDELLASHNKPDNCYGDRLQIIIGSEKIALGLTIKHVRRVYITMPHWNIPSIEQALARGFRFGSHDALKPEERIIKIFRLVAVEKGDKAKGTGFPANAAFAKDATSDIDVYKIAEVKEHKNTQIYRILKEASYDCALNYARNVLETDVDGSRECDYTKCNYQCDAFPSSKVDKTGKVYNYQVRPESLDYSTYNLFYSSEKVRDYRDKIVALFNNYFSLRIDMVRQLLAVEDGEKSEDEKSSDQKSEDEKSDDEKSEDYALMKAIDMVIESRVLIRNRYGFGCYLKEQNGILFLDNSISPKANYPEASYIENPLVIEKTSMDALVEIMELDRDKKNVQKFCKDPSAELFDTFSHSTKIVLLEASYSMKQAAEKGMSPAAVKFVLDAMSKDNIHTMSDGAVIHILHTEEFKGIAYNVAAKDIKVTGLMRSFDPEEQTWKYVENKSQEEKYVKELKSLTAKSKDGFADNPYGVVGWISKKDKAFRVQVKQDPSKKGKSRGKKCIDYPVPDLVEIFIKRIKHLPPAKEEYKTLEKKELIKRIKGKIGVGFEDYKKNLDTKTEKYLRGLLTLLMLHKDEFCKELEKWFGKNDLLLEK